MAERDSSEINIHEVLGLVVNTHENSLPTFDQPIRIGPYGSSDIKKAMAGAFEKLFSLSSPPVNDLANSENYSSRSIDRPTRRGSLHLSNTRIYDWRCTDIAGAQPEVNNLALFMDLRPDAMPEAKLAAGGGDLAKRDLSYTTFLLREASANSTHKKPIIYTFSLLEEGEDLLGGRTYLTGFFDHRPEIREWDGKAIRCSVADFLKSPTIEKYRYLWRGLRWMCVNILEWNNNRVWLPEDLDRVSLPHNSRMIFPSLTEASKNPDTLLAVRDGESDGNTQK